MADHYPKQRHRPAPADQPAESQELSPADQEAVAEQRALFFEFFGREGYAFFSGLFAEGCIDGWRSVRNVHSIIAPCPPDDESDYLISEPDFQPYPHSSTEEHN